MRFNVVLENVFNASILKIISHYIVVGLNSDGKY